MPTDDRPHSQRAADVLAAFEYDDLTTNEQLLASRVARAQVHATLAVGEQLVRLNRLVERIADVLGQPTTMELLRRGVHVVLDETAPALDDDQLARLAEMPQTLDGISTPPRAAGEQ